MNSVDLDPTWKIDTTHMCTYSLTIFRLLVGIPNPLRHHNVCSGTSVVVSVIRRSKYLVGSRSHFWVASTMVIRDLHSSMS